MRLCDRATEPAWDFQAVVTLQDAATATAMPHVPILRMRYAFYQIVLLLLHL